MKALFFCFAVTVAACGNLSTQDDTQSAIGTDPLRWMLGTWNCTSGYHSVPPFFKAHQAVATYTVTQDLDGVIHGQYKETSADADLVSFEDEWSIGTDPIDSLGNVPATLKAAVSDGSLTSGSGTDRGPSASGVVLGVASFEGVITLPDGSVQNWHYSATDLAPSSSTPAIHFSSNWSIGTATVKQVYLGMTCIQSP